MARCRPDQVGAIDSSAHMAIAKDNDIASIRARLEELDTERNALAERLERLRSRQAPKQPSGVVPAPRNPAALPGGAPAGEPPAPHAAFPPNRNPLLVSL